MGACISSDSKVAENDWFEVPKVVSKRAVERKPTKLTTSKTIPDISKISTAKNLLKAKSSRNPDEAVVAAWVVNGSGWSMAYDENYNIYYYRDDGSSSWDPPQVVMSDGAWQSFASDTIIKVPDDVDGGQVFSTSFGEARVDVFNPVGSWPGTALQLLAPVASDNSGATSDRAAIDVSTIDTSLVWAEFSTCADLDYGEISDDMAAAHKVLEEIASGSYRNDLIFQLSWAYKLRLLETAAKDCYARRGDYFNSEMYDNCNGIPKYAERGLIDWWQDLRSMHISIEQRLSSSIESKRLFGKTDIDDLFHAHAHDIDLDTFESSTKDEQLALLIEKRDNLGNELDTLTAQMLAIVSIDGGPSAEPVETVHDYLKDFLERDLAIEDNKDEIDEFVSNALEPRHKFVVTTILNMVLLEQQLEALEREIANHHSSSTHAEEAELAKEEAAAAPAESSAADEVRALIAKQDADVRNLEAALLMEHSAKKAALQARLAKSRQGRVKDKMAADPSLTEDAASAAVDEAIREEERRESEEIDNDLSQLDNLRSCQLRDLKNAADIAGSKLKESLEGEKAKCIRDLQQRLQDKMAAKKRDVQSSESSGGEDTGFAIEQALAAAEEQAVEERLSAETLFASRESAGRMEILNALREQHDVATERLRVTLGNQEEARRRALATRLEKKVNARAISIISAAAAHGEQVSLQHALQLAGGEFEGERAAEEAAIKRATKEKMAVEKSSIASSLRDAFDRESASMQVLLMEQERLHKSGLQERLALKKRQKAAELQKAILTTDAPQAAEARLQAELAQEEAKLNETCGAALQALKANYESMGEVLREELAMKGKKISESLAKRLQKRNQIKAKSLSASLSTLSLKQTMSKMLSLPEVPEEPGEHVQSVNDITAAIKRDQVGAIMRLKKLINGEREHELAEVAKKKDATSAIKGSILLNFSLLLDNSVVGLKKRNLYLVKAIKDFADKKETNKDVLTDAEYAQLTSTDAIKSVCREASDQLLARVGRDINGICDCQATEDLVLRAKAVGNCTPAGLMHDAQRRKSDANMEHISGELRKGAAALVGIWVDVASLLASGGSESQRSVGDGDELDDDDDSSDAYNYPLAAAAKKWIRDVYGALSMCDDSVTNLHLHLTSAHYKALGIDAIADKAKLYESSLYYCRNALKHIVLMAASTFCSKLISNTFIAKDYQKLLNAELNKDGRSLAEVLAKDNNVPEDIKAAVMILFQVAIKNFSKTPIMQKSEEKKFMKQLNVDIKKLLGDDGKHGRVKTGGNIRCEQLLKGFDEVLKKKKQDLLGRLTRKQAETMKTLTDPSFAINPNAQDAEVIETEIKSLKGAQETVRKIVASISKEENAKTKVLDSISVETLLLSVDKILKGGKVESPADLMTVQMESLQAREAEQVENIKAQQAQSDEKLDLALKMKQAKDKQQLQKRLLNKKSKA